MFGEAFFDRPFSFFYVLFGTMETSSEVNGIVHLTVGVTRKPNLLFSRDDNSVVSFFYPMTNVTGVSHSRWKLSG